MIKEQIDLLTKKALALATAASMAITLPSCSKEAKQTGSTEYDGSTEIVETTKKSKKKYVVIQSGERILIFEYEKNDLSWHSSNSQIYLPNGDVINTYNTFIYYVEGYNAREDAYLLAESLAGENGVIEELNFEENLELKKRG